MNIQSVKFQNLTFYNVSDPQELEMKFLRKTFEFSSLHLDDYLNKTTIPKIEVDKRYSLVVLDFPYFDKPSGNGEKTAPLDKKTSLPDKIAQSLPLPHFPTISPKRRLHTGLINFFIGKDYLVVLHDKNLPQVDEIFALCQKAIRFRQEYMSEGPIFLFYRIVDALVDASIATVNELSSTIDFIDKQLATNRTSDIDEEISATRRNIVVFQTMIKPALPIFADLEKAKYKEFGENMTPFWANILDHLQKIWDRLEDSRELIEGISTSYESLLTVRTNEIIKLLTMFTAILLPLTLIASIYGMNIHLPFQADPNAFLYISEAMVVIAFGMILYFKYKNWL